MERVEVEQAKHRLLCVFSYRQVRLEGYGATILSFANPLNLGANRMDEWVGCRVEGDALKELGSG